MAIDDTIHDSPITPGPVFAYRAFRGFLFGSPGTPAPVPTFYPVSQDDKENIPITDALPKPLPSKTRPFIESNLKLTPSSKRKRSSGTGALLSPTKSCLRTPGAITPRRVMLKDMNVTFKDRSISPELVRKDTQPGAAAVQQDQKPPLKAREMRNIGAVSVETSNAAVATLVTTQKQTAFAQPVPQTTQIALPAITSNFDIQAYIQNSEKDMKKLIRYGQKMRDYARKQDEENSKLKKLIEDLKRENERLRLGEHADRSTTTQRNASAVPVRTDTAKPHHKTDASSGVIRPLSPSKRSIAIVEHANGAGSDLPQQNKRMRPSRPYEIQNFDDSKKDIGTGREPSSLADVCSNPRPLRSTTVAAVTATENKRPPSRLNSHDIQTRLQHTPASSRAQSRAGQFAFGSSGDDDDRRTTKAESNTAFRSLTNAVEGKRSPEVADSDAVAVSVNTHFNPVINHSVTGTSLPPDRRARARARLQEKSQLRKGGVVTAVPIFNAATQSNNINMNINMNADGAAESNKVEIQTAINALSLPLRENSNARTYLSTSQTSMSARTRLTHEQKEKQTDRFTRFTTGTVSTARNGGALGNGAGSSSILSDWAGL